MDPDYSKRELDRIFHYVAKELKDIKEDQQLIKEQVTFTNGKVRKLIIAGVAIGFFSVGLGFQQIGPLLMLLL